MPYTVLLVDDDPYFRSEFKETLHEFNVIGAKNGKEALTILGKPHNIDLVILDQKMPGMTGTELLKEIDKMPSRIRTVLLTGQGSKDTAIKGLRNNATEYIEKPLNEKKLAKIKNLILSVPKGEKYSNTGGVRGKVEQAKYFAERNYNKSLTLKDVADEVCLSPKYLSRVFKKYTGIRFSEYRLRIRMDKAKEMLLIKGYNVEQVAHQMGYQNPESFIKVFCKFNHRTPKQFQDKASQIPMQKSPLISQVEELNEVKESLAKEKYFSGLGRLAATVAHELRHPLGVIKTAMWNIRKKVNDSSIDDNLKSIKKMIFEQEQIINNLLEYSKIKKPVYESVRIRDIINDVVTGMKLRLDQNRVSIIKSLKAVGNKEIETDALQVKEILTNLFTNAYEALPENKKGKISIKAWIDQEFLVVQVNDNGQGIDPDDSERIFEAFFSRKPKGTGLGLSISYEIIHMHGGSIDIDSCHGKGTTVTVKFPLKANHFAHSS